MKVLVWGAGETGYSTAHIMQARGHEVRLADESPKAAAKGIPVIALQAADIQWADLVIPSPGIPRNHPLFAQARKVRSEIEIAMELLSGCLVAITGTNGKTTTTTLIHRILQKAGLDAGIGGNISPPLISLADTNPAYVVAEISSFQLEWIEKFRPAIGICMNITPDHLDRYASMEEYIHYKLRLFENMQGDDLAIIYNDDPYKDLITTPRRAGFSLERGQIADGAYIAEGRIMFHGERAGKGPRVPDMAAIGRGTVEDMLAAALATRYLDVDVAVMEDVFMTFRLIHHRFERVGEAGGVIFVDDSKATNVGALDIALKSIAGNSVVILGGKDKGGDFGEIARRYQNKIRAAVLIGEAALRIEHELASLVPCTKANDMEEAVAVAYAKAQSGDVVLLAPGCASFDMFKSYAHRGEVFVACVKKLMEQTTL